MWLKSTWHCVLLSDIAYPEDPFSFSITFAPRCLLGLTSQDSCLAPELAKQSSHWGLDSQNQIKSYTFIGLKWKSTIYGTSHSWHRRKYGLQRGVPKIVTGLIYFVMSKDPYAKQGSIQCRPAKKLAKSAVRYTKFEEKTLLEQDKIMCPWVEIINCWALSWNNRLRTWYELWMILYNAGE